MTLNLNDVDALEKHFARYAESTIFPVLADHYYRQQDYEHARGVCEIGLDRHPDSVDGNFILSKVELIDRNLTDAEKLLRVVVTNDPVHIYAHRLLMQVQITLKRSDNTIRKVVEKLMAVYPEDDECKLWLKEHPKDSNSSSDTDEIPSVSETPPSPAIQSVAAADSIAKDYIKVSSRMATFTLAEVFKKQENYFQALEILSIVESKGGDKERVLTERAIIEKLMKEQEAADD